MKTKTKTKEDLKKELEKLTAHLRAVEESLQAAEKQNKELLAAGKLARSILDQSTEVIIVCDENGRIVRTSQLAHRYFSGKLLGKPFNSVCPLSIASPSPLQPKQFSISSVLSGKIIRAAEVTYRRDETQEVYFLMNAKLLTHNGKGVLGCIVTLTDITEHKRIEEALRGERERLAALINSIRDEVWFADTTGHFRLVNPSGSREFHLDTDAATDVRQLAARLEVFRPDGTARPIEEAPPLRALSGEVVTRQEELIRTPATGELRYRQVSAAPVRDGSGNIIGSVSIVRDITDFERLHEELRRSRDELELRVQERTAEVAKANEELQAEITERKRTEEALRKLTHDLNERVKEINCLYSISYYVDKQYLLLEEKLKNIVELIPSGSQFPEIACARIILEDKEYKTDNFRETPWKQFSDIIVHDEKVGRIEVFYLEKSPEDYEGPFSKEERGLINTIAVEIGEMFAHMQAEKVLAEQSRILEAFFTSTITPFVFLDKNFNFIRVNEAYAKACQRNISEFPGHNHFEFYPSDARPIFEKVVETKTPFQVFARPFAFPDHPEWGVTYWNWTLTPILDSRGEVEFLVFALQDVTERKRGEEAVRAERQRFNDVLEILPAYLVLLASDYHVPFANRFFTERFGESNGKRCFEYLFGRNEPCEICETYTVLKTGAPHHWEWTGPDARNYDVFDFPFTDTDGSTLILEVGIDITERKQAEEALRAAHQYNRGLIETSLDPLVTISADGKIMDVNSATEVTAGVPRDELIGTDFSDYFTEPEKAREGYQRVFREGSVRDYPLAIRHTSGKVTEVLYHATVFRNQAGEIQGVFAAARDITVRRRGEKALRESENRLRELSAELINVQEGERKRISREIHDSIGQTLAAIKFALESKLSQMGGASAPAGVSIENIISLTQSAIEESRRIQMDLRPSILDDLGILATIGWFTREFQKVYTHVSVEKHISVREDEIPDSLRTVLFRVIQEAMNNVAKHSKADLARLILKKTADKIELSVEDTGEGFDLETIKRGLGLTSMRERIQLSGGSLEIESTLGKGTTIRARWPL